MSYRSTQGACGCNSCGCGCSQPTCNTCSGCCSSPVAQVHPASYMPQSQTTGTETTVDCDPPCWEEKLMIDFDPIWQGTITNGKIEDGQLVALQDGPLTFESRPISMGVRDSYIVELEAPIGVSLRYRYANTSDGLAIQQYENANGVHRNFMYLQILATVESE